MLQQPFRSQVLHGAQRAGPGHDPVLPERADGDVGHPPQPVGGGSAVRLHRLGQGTAVSHGLARFLFCWGHRLCALLKCKVGGDGTAVRL